MKSFLKSLADPYGSQNTDPDAIRYAGLNIRLMANLLDLILMIVLTAPLLMFKPDAVELSSSTPQEVVHILEMRSKGQITDEQFSQMMMQSNYLQDEILPRLMMYMLINFLVVGVIYVLCWHKWNSTPGKLIFGIKIVDDQTLGNPTTRQYIVRFLGYFVSMMTLFIGFIMIGMNKKKRGLHDMMAGTLVIYGKPFSLEFEKKKLKWKVYVMLITLAIGAIYLSGKM